uniref:Epidermal growth factor receptor kinase substrate 8-like protein 2 n=1 Tax=Lygus hesperus TaxID=30085 RepID=A0A0A9Y404_LYGHE
MKLLLLNKPLGEKSEAFSNVDIALIRLSRFSSDSVEMFHKRFDDVQRLFFIQHQVLFENPIIQINRLYVSLLRFQNRSEGHSLMSPSFSPPTDPTYSFNE